MSDLRLQPRSPTELVDAAFQVYRREPVPFILALAIVYVPWMILMGALGLANPDVAPSPWLIFLSTVGGLGIYALAVGVTTKLADDVYFGRPADLGRAFGLVWSKLPPLIIVSIAASLAIGLGAILLFFPAFYMLARYFAAQQLVLLEGLGANASLRRTADLSKGHKWHILKTLGLIFVVNLAIVFGASMLGAMIPSPIIRLLVSTVASVVAYPMFGIGETLLYYDIRIRKEGFDIEYLAAAIEPVTAGT